MTDEQKQEAEIVQVGLDSLAFIDRTIYCNEDNPATVLWKNSEVMELSRRHSRNCDCRSDPSTSGHPHIGGGRFPIPGRIRFDFTVV